MNLVFAKETRIPKCKQSLESHKIRSSCDAHRLYPPDFRAAYGVQILLSDSFVGFFVSVICWIFVGDSVSDFCVILYAMFRPILCLIFCWILLS